LEHHAYFFSIKPKKKENKMKFNIKIIPSSSNPDLDTIETTFSIYLEEYYHDILLKHILTTLKNTKELCPKLPF